MLYYSILFDIILYYDCKPGVASTASRVWREVRLSVGAASRRIRERTTAMFVAEGTKGVIPVSLK